MKKFRLRALRSLRVCLRIMKEKLNGYDRKVGNFYELSTSHSEKMMAEPAGLSNCEKNVLSYPDEVDLQC